MRGPLVLTIASLAALSTATQADALPIKGSYGNKDSLASDAKIKWGPLPLCR